MTPATILQFKITLLDIEPPIWRLIQVPDRYTVFDLHVAIQSAMGWQGRLKGWTGELGGTKY